ncbi:MAG: UDP-N-acetylmuramoyl-L-alanine--D-glutamate ligase, partial [Planctomycetota bacterium]
VISALKSLGQPIYLIAGGADKGANFDRVATAIVARAAAAYFIGSTAGRWRQAVLQASPQYPAGCFHSLPQAFAAAVRDADVGSAILLSPGCSSLDQFTSFEARGRAFRALAKDDCGRPSSPAIL